MFDQSNNTGAIDAKMDDTALEEKSNFKMLGCLSVRKWIGALTLFLYYFIALLNLIPRKLEP